MAVAVAVAGSYSSDSMPSLGISICHGAALKRQKKKNYKSGKKNSFTMEKSGSTTFMKGSKLTAQH